MNCEWVRKNSSLFLYGELSLQEEQDFQDHVEACGECRRAFEADKAIHQVLDNREVELPPALLARCRRDLDLRLSAAPRRGGLLGWFRSALGGWNLQAAWLKPVGAAALVAVGFFGSRLIERPASEPSVVARLPGSSAEPMSARVRYLQPEPSGKVRLVIEETRQRFVTGDPDAEPIRRLLLTAAREAADPGLRADSMDLLRQHADSQELRSALLHALEHDPNPGVRLRALDGLKAFAAQPDVRQGLTQALLGDDNPGVRTQAIDLLLQNLQQHREESLVSVLQELVQKDSNNYIRLRSQKALQEMNASVGTF